MNKVLIINQKYLKTMPIGARVCSGFFDRLRGLMFKDRMDDQDSILIDQGFDSRINSAIHMLFMKFEIAAIWINSDKLVVDVKIAKPWRIAYMPAQSARYILETQPKFASNFSSGDQLEFIYE